MRETTSLRSLSLAAMAVLAALAGSGRALAQEVEHEQGAAHHKRHPRPLAITRQGSFAVGGKVIHQPGEFDPTAFPPPPDGQSAYGDHAYVQFQIPPNRRRYPLVLWHGGGQFGKTWESTPDGRDGYQTIFLRRGWAVYIVDQPRRGRAGSTTEGTTVSPGFNDAFLFNVFRLGTWDAGGPQFFPNVSFPRDSASLDQYFRQVTPDTGPLDAEVVSDALAALFRKIGPAILVTHSQSGIYGWLTALKEPDLVKGIIAYEPTQFVLPEGETPVPVQTQVPGWLAFLDALSPNVSADTFRQLARIPIQLVYGDHIPTQSTRIAGHELWYITRLRSAQFVDALNRHGGDAKILYLPDVGLHGNTHFPFSDLNNREVANLMSRYLHEKGLDERVDHSEDKDVAAH
jgi:pimeloyl-ACP methyl ester carboxylesterase